MQLSTLTRIMASVFALTLAVGTVAVTAQEPEPLPAQEPAPVPAEPQPLDEAQVLSAEGELLRVDAENKMFWIRPAAGNEEQQFAYTDETEVTGENRNIEGLATMTGTQVQVEYRAEGGQAVATRIAIQAAEVQ